MFERKFKDYFIFYEVVNNNAEIIKCICFNESIITIPSYIDNIKVLKIVDHCFELEEWNFPTEIIVEEGIEEIEDYAFCGCNLLKKIVIPSTVKKIGRNIIDECPSLEELKIDDKNEFYSSFGNHNVIVEKKTNALLYTLASSIIPSNVKIIKQNAFNNLFDLQELIIPEGCEVLEEASINNCMNLKSIKVPSTLKVARNAIKDC